MIYNNYDIIISKEEIYNSVFRYELPEGYYFEAYGTNYGNVVYGRDELQQTYFVKKREEDNE